MAESVKFGDAQILVERINEETVLLKLHDAHGLVVGFQGTPDEAEVLKNALEKADSTAPPTKETK